MKCMPALIAPLFLLPTLALANAQLSQLHSIAPDQFQDTKAACEQWAEDDQVTPDDHASVVGACIINALGYLLAEEQPLNNNESVEDSSQDSYKDE